MRKNLPLINFVLIIFLFIAVMYLLNKFSVLFVSAAISDSVVDKVGIEVVLDRIDSNFTLIVTVVTILFGFLGVASFIGIKEGLSSQIKSLEKIIDEQKEAWLKHDKYIKSVEGDLSYDTGRSAVAEMDKNKIINDKIGIVESGIVACSYYSKSLSQKMDVNRKFKEAVTSEIKRMLGEVDKLLILEKEKLLLHSMGYERYLRAEVEIHKIADKDMKQTLASIFSKIDFKDFD